MIECHSIKEVEETLNQVSESNKKIIARLVTSGFTRESYFHFSDEVWYQNQKMHGAYNEDGEVYFFHRNPDNTRTDYKFSMMGPTSQFALIRKVAKMLKVRKTSKIW